MSAAGSAEQLPDQPTGQVADAEGAMADEGAACLGLSELACGANADRAYPHPLSGVARVRGKLPYVELRESPDGRVYALGESGWEGEDRRVERRSGVVELEHRRLGSDERKRARQAKVEADPEAERDASDEATTTARVPRATKLDPRLRARLAEVVASRASGLIPVELRVPRRPDREPLQSRLDRAIAEGRITTYGEYELTRAELLAEVRDEIASDLAPLRARLRAQGGQEAYVCQHMGCLVARLPAAAVTALDADADVVLAELAEATLRSEVDASPNSTDGFDMSHVHQTRRFWDATVNGSNLDGENGSAESIRVAVIDSAKFRATHVAFREGSGTANRITGMFDCTAVSGGCQSVTGWTGLTRSHGTAVAAAALGDYRDGQLSTVTTTAGRERYSAVSGEAHAYLYDPGELTDSSLNDVFDHIIGRSPQPLVAVFSEFLSPEPVLGCSAAHAAAWLADDLFEAGTLLFKSAGNNNPFEIGVTGSSTVCSVTRPGDAMGVFTTGMYTSGGTICDERNSSASNSSWGGSPTVYTQGRKRSIVDMLGPSNIPFLPDITNDTAILQGASTGTSFANPAVASGAVAFLDMMHNVVGTTFADRPGMLFAWMLAMGDRRSATGSRLATGFDQRTGAGGPNFRFLDATGMDSPWGYGHTELCVGHGQVVKAAIPSQVVATDALQAAIYWYDRRVENDTDYTSTDLVDDLDLKLVKRSTGEILVQSIHAWDNKERVWYADIGGLGALDLEIHGYNVTSDETGCGTNSMRVWLAFTYEDSDRNDADGPSWNASTCEGVRPL